VQVGFARAVVRMLLGFREGQHRRHAGIARLEDLGPFVARLHGEARRDRRAHRLPLRAVVLRAGEALFQRQEPRKLGEELRLQAGHGDVTAIRRLVGVVEGRAGIEQVRTAPLLPESRRHPAEIGGGEHGRPVDHGGVDDLALAGAPALEQRRQYAGDQEHGPAAIVGHQIERRHRFFALPPDGGEHPGIGQIGEVVAGARGKRPVLPEARHAAVDEGRIARQNRFRTGAEPLHHARPEAFDQHIRIVEQAQEQFHALGPLEVELEDVAAVPVEIEFRPHVEEAPARREALDAQHRGTHFRKHQAGERHRPEPRHLDHLQPGKRACPDGRNGSAHCGSRTKLKRNFVPVASA
jgi:hypothetical protein